MTRRAGAEPVGGAAGGAPARVFEPAGRSVRAWALLLGLTAALLGIDLATKYWAFHGIADRPVPVERERVLEVMSRDPGLIQALVPEHEPRVVAPGVLELKLVLNPGAVFGIGAGRRVFFVVFTAGAVGFVCYLFARWVDRRDWLSAASLALILAGGIGNLYDRLRYACVRDFLHPLPGVPMPFGLRWPNGSPELWPYVSNVADAFLLVGIGVLLVRLWRAPAPEEQEAGAGERDARGSEQPGADETTPERG